MDIGSNDFNSEELLHYVNLLNLAEDVAAVAHEKQKDRTGRPYINHPQTVSSFCKTTYAKIVAWLHDVVEDTSITLEDLAHLGFDDFLIEALRLVTKEKGYDINEYYERIKKNPIAKEVKLADLKHNTDLSRIPEDAPEKLKQWAINKRNNYLQYIEYLKGDNDDKPVFKN